MKLKNFEIYGIAENLIKMFSEADSTQKLPIKLSFAIRKNLITFQNAATEIEKSKLEILNKYGKTEDGQKFIFDNPDSEQSANQEFTDLMMMEDDINIYEIDINSLRDDVQISNVEMDAIMFMLVEKKED